MSGFIYMIAEGVFDVELLALVLQQGFHATLIQKQPDLPQQASDWLDNFKWPVKDDISRRSVPAPVFLKNDHFLIILRNARGLDNIKDTLDLDMDAFSRKEWMPHAISIFFDADNTVPDTRFMGYADILARVGYPQPARLEEVARSGGRCGGIFAFPGQNLPGTLEDILLPLARQRFPDLMIHAESYSQQIYDNFRDARDFRELRKPGGSKKATLAAAVAVLKPGRTMVASMQDQNWLPDDPRACQALTPLMDFLEALLAGSQPS